MRLDETHMDQPENVADPKKLFIPWLDWKVEKWEKLDWDQGSGKG